MREINPHDEIKGPSPSGPAKNKKSSKNGPNAYSVGGKGILAFLLSDSIVLGQCLMSIMIT
jgi:hypothetical protein